MEHFTTGITKLTLIFKLNFHPSRLIRSGVTYKNANTTTQHLIFTHQGPVVRKSNNANPRLKVNRGFHLAR